MIKKIRSIKTMRKLISMAMAVTFTCGIFAGCASSPDNIKAAHVSKYQYQSMTCQQIGEEMAVVERKLAAICDQQQRTATKDAVAMSIGLIVFWPALLALPAGDDNKTEIANLKGEYEALEQMAISKECSVVLTEIQERKEKAAQEEQENLKASKDSSGDSYR